MESRIIEVCKLALITILAYLAILHIRHIDVFMFKLGVTHFFSPILVGILAYGIPIIEIISIILILLINKRQVFLAPGILFFLYLLYNTILFIATGDDCGCANILFDYNLKYQIAIFFLLVISCIYLYLRNSRQIKLLKK